MIYGEEHHDMQRSNAEERALSSWITVDSTLIWMPLIASGVTIARGMSEVMPSIIRKNQGTLPRHQA